MIKFLDSFSYEFKLFPDDDQCFINMHSKKHLNHLWQAITLTVLLTILFLHVSAYINLHIYNGRERQLDQFLQIRTWDATWDHFHRKIIEISHGLFGSSPIKPLPKWFGGLCSELIVTKILSINLRRGLHIVLFCSHDIFVPGVYKHLDEVASPEFEHSFSLSFYDLKMEKLLHFA